MGCFFLGCSRELPEPWVSFVQDPLQIFVEEHFPKDFLVEFVQFLPTCRLSFGVHLESHEACLSPKFWVVRPHPCSLRHQRQAAEIPRSEHVTEDLFEDGFRQKREPVGFGASLTPSDPYTFHVSRVQNHLHPSFSHGRPCVRFGCVCTCVREVDGVFRATIWTNWYCPCSQGRLWTSSGAKEQTSRSVPAEARRICHDPLRDRRR